MGLGLNRTDDRSRSWTGFTTSPARSGRRSRLKRSWCRQTDTLPRRSQREREGTDRCSISGNGRRSVVIVRICDRNVSVILFLRARAEVHLGEASRRVAQSTSLIGHCVNRDRGYLGVPADSQSFFLPGVISCTNQTLSICTVTLSSSPPSSDPAEKCSIIQTPIPHLPLLAPHPTLRVLPHRFPPQRHPPNAAYLESFRRTADLWVSRVHDPSRVKTRFTTLG